MIEAERRPQMDQFLNTYSNVNLNSDLMASTSAMPRTLEDSQQPPNFNVVSYLPRPAYRFKPTLSINPSDTEGGYGRRLRRNLAQVRRHIDCVASVLNYIENRCWQKDKAPNNRPFIQPHVLYSTDSFPPIYNPERSIDCVTTKFVRSAMNKVKCPIYDVCWTPEGRRLITGASSGEFTLWNGTAFNFETILQAHDSAVRAMKWSHNDAWLTTADHDGFVKYWQTNMNNVTMFQAHKEAVRSLSFCPSDAKFASASDDGTVRVWDFLRCHEERILRGHGSDVRSVDWHPNKSLLVSGSRDSQQPVKLWDPKTAQCLATLYDHKNAVMAVQWNANGNWFLSASRDHLVKLYDIRMMKELFSFRGHKKEVTAISWHPIHESLFVSGGADGAMMFWLVGNEREVGLMETAHEQAVWTLKWHPLGHILASGSNDNNTKFWTRNKPGDILEDFHGMVSTNPFDQSSSAQRHHQSTADHSQAKVESSPMKKDAQHTSWPLANRQSSASEELPGISSKPEPKASKHDHAAPSSSAIPGLGGVEQFGTHGNGHSNLPLTLPAGARKTLLKQPPPKKAQRQFERVWNVSNDRFASEYDEGSSAADNEYRYNNRSEDNRISADEIYRHHHDEQQQAPVQKRRQDDTMSSVNPYAQGQPPIKKFYPAIPSLMNAAPPPGMGADGGPPQVMDLLPVPYDLGPGGWEETLQNSGQPGWDSSGQVMPQKPLDIRPPFGDIDFRRQPKPPFGDNFAARFPPMPPPGSGLPMPLMMAPIPVPPVMNAPKDPRQMKIAINLSTTSLQQQQQQQSHQQQKSESIIIGPQLPIPDPRLTRDPRSRATSQAEQMTSYMSGGNYAALLDAQSSMMANMMSGGGDMDPSRSNAGGGSPLVNPKRKWKRDYEAEEEEKRYEPDIYGNSGGGNETPPPNNYGANEKRNSGGGGSDVDERHRKRYW